MFNWYYVLWNVSKTRELIYEVFQCILHQIICDYEVNVNKIWSLKTSLNKIIFFYYYFQIKNIFPLVTFEDSWGNRNITGEIWKFTGVILTHYLIG